MADPTTDTGWSIHVKAVDIFPVTGVLNPSHLIISVRDPTGEEVLQLNGGALDENGKIQTTVLTDGSKLAAFSSANVGDTIITGPVLMDKEVFVGSRADVFERLDMMAQAAKAINEGDHKYRAYDPIGDATNSNSVAAALLKAGRLELPEEVADLWIPGLSTKVLPDDWNPEQPDRDNPSTTIDRLKQIGSTELERQSQTPADSNEPIHRNDPASPSFGPE